MAGKRYMCRILTVCTLLVLAAPMRTLAQDNIFDEYLTFHGGLVTGVNFSQVDGDNFAGYSKAGLNVGGIVYFNMDPEHVKGSLEVLYTQKGARSKGMPYTVAPGLYITNYRITLNYAEVPFMINYFDRHMHHFGGGFSLSYIGTKRENIEFSPAQPLVNLDDYPVNKTDLNMLVGGSLHCWKGLFFNMRFQYSLLSIRNKVPVNYGRSQQFNNMWTLRMVYLFK
ncbi:hypothetical protein GCM10023093_30860 [Nemorincola caseinilytica]|uniref:Outer membrane protein beta-barrel domain-containing protein n=1 Tax=Nemorincola caseinilytica TaxID=2054315 RepID=A0ABP8NRK7_9BACT